MKFFKHFTDAHRGQSLQGLMDELGHMGLTYWILVEMCVEKLDEKLGEKEIGERLQKEDCKFEFHQRILRQNLRVSATNLRRILDECSTLDLLEYESDGKIVKISMPKILKSLERTKKKDVKSTSSRRQNDVLEEDIDKDKEEDLEVAPQTWIDEAEFWFETVRNNATDFAAQQALGPERKPFIEKLGGIKFVRSLKQNDFETKRLARMIMRARAAVNFKESA